MTQYINPYVDFLKLLEEWQAMFLRAFTGPFQMPGTSGSGGSSASRREFDIDAVLGTVPMGLLTRAADEEVNAYFVFVNQFLGSLGEDQFLLPKALVLSLQELVSVYMKMYRVAQSYESMFRGAWDRSMKGFAIEVKKAAPISEFKAFSDTFRSVFADEYSRLLASPDFVKTQTDFIETVSNYYMSMRKVMEAQAAMVPGLPFVTRSDMSAVVKNVHSYKKRVDGLERRLRKGISSEDAAQRVKSLEQRIGVLEVKLAGMHKAGGNGGGKAAGNHVPRKPGLQGTGKS